MKTVKAGNVVFGEGRVKICVPVTAADASELLEAVKRLSAPEIDLIEFRADYYRDKPFSVKGNKYPKSRTDQGKIRENYGIVIKSK